MCSGCRVSLSASMGREKVSSSQFGLTSRISKVIDTAQPRAGLAGQIRTKAAELRMRNSRPRDRSNIREMQAWEIKRG